MSATREIGKLKSNRLGESQQLDIRSRRNIPVEDNNNRKCLKRCISVEDKLYKKLHQEQTVTTSSSSKNLAQNRLHKLRKNFKEDSKDKRVSREKKNISIDSTCFSGQTIKTNTKTIKAKYKDTYLSTASSYKNLASTRLKRIKNIHEKNEGNIYTREKTFSSRVKETNNSKNPSIMQEQPNEKSLKRSKSQVKYPAFKRKSQCQDVSSRSLSSDSGSRFSLFTILDTSNSKETSKPIIPVNTKTLDVNNDNFGNDDNNSFTKTYKDNIFINHKHCDKPVACGSNKNLENFSKKTIANKREQNNTQFLMPDKYSDFLSEEVGSNGHCSNTNSNIAMKNLDSEISSNESKVLYPPEDVPMEWDPLPESTDSPPAELPKPIETNKKDVICLVTDTNVFMHFLTKIRDIINFNVTGSEKIKVYIPWMVLRELDDIKDSSSNKDKNLALSAEKFINRYLVQPDSKLIGQTLEEMIEQKDIGISPDDKILASCIQVVEKYNTVILLTNDVNLRNKALINKLETSAPNDILQKLLFRLKKNTKFLKISQKVSRLCSQIIAECCQEAYGDVWSEMNLLQDPPWNLTECLKRFEKYWTSVFKEKILKHCYKIIQLLYQFLIGNKDGIIDDSDTFNEFMKQVLSFLVFLKDIPGYRSIVKNTINEVIKVADS